MKNFIIIFTLSIFSLIFCLLGKCFLPDAPGKNLPSKLVSEETAALSTRNTFTQEVIRHPLTTDWTGIELFTKSMQTLELDQSIASIFQDSIQQFGTEPYYAGAYRLQNDLFCPLLWFSDNQQFSFGIEWTGNAAKIRELANAIVMQLGPPTEKETGTTEEKQYWLQKKYKNMDYFIGFTLTLTDENATLDLNVHPQIYH